MRLQRCTGLLEEHAVEEARQRYRAQVAKDLAAADERERVQKEQQAIKDAIQTGKSSRDARLQSMEVATFEGWAQIGVCVKKGQKAHKSDGIYVFHKSQTIAKDV